MEWMVYIYIYRHSIGYIYIIFSRYSSIHIHTEYSYWTPWYLDFFGHGGSAARDGAIFMGNMTSIHWSWDCPIFGEAQIHLMFWTSSVVELRLEILSKGLGRPKLCAMFYVFFGFRSDLAQLMWDAHFWWKKPCQNIWNSNRAALKYPWHCSICSRLIARWIILGPREPATVIISFLSVFPNNLTCKAC